MNGMTWRERMDQVFSFMGGGFSFINGVFSFSIKHYPFSWFYFESSISLKHFLL